MALRSGRVGIHPSQVDPITGMLLHTPGGASDLSDLDDVAISSVSNDQILRYNSTTEKWENKNLPSGSVSNLSDLDDVAISSVSNDQILRYNSTSEKWENEDMPPIPAAQVNSDWNAASGVAQILNKPTIPTNVSDLTNGYTITSAVTALTGATSATITNAAIHTTSMIEVFSDPELAAPTKAVTEGECVLTFPALAADTSFKLRITN